MKFRFVLFILALLVIVPTVFAQEGEGHHQAEVINIMWLAGSMIIGAMAGEAGKRIGLPAVIGQVVAGFIVFNIARIIFHDHFALAYQGLNGEIPIIAVDSYKGWMKIALLAIMFGAGLSEEPKHFRGQFISGLPLAVLGAVIPAVFVGVFWYFINFEGMAGNILIQTVLFSAIVMSATSISISAQVIADINGAKSTKEALRGFAAAVGDDVVGLALLSTVVAVDTALATGVGINYGILSLDVVIILVKAIGFVIVATYFGPILFGWLIKYTNWMNEAQFLILFFWALVGAWFAAAIGLEDVLGAFVFGLSAYSMYWKMVIDQDDANDIYEPIQITQSSTHIFYHVLPVFTTGFFFSVGGQIQVEALLSPMNLLIAFIIALIGLVGKFLAAWMTSRGMNWVPVGAIMVARGEVGLIIVAIGIGFGAFSTVASNILIVSVMLTTIVGPLLTKWAFNTQQTTPAPNGNGNGH